MARQAGPCPCGDDGRVGNFVADVTEGSHGSGGSPTVGVTGPAVGSELGGRGGHVSVPVRVELSRQERDRVRRRVRMAERGVVATGLSPRRRRGSGMTDRVVGGTQGVALGADGGIRWIGGRVRGARPASKPGLHRVRGHHPVTGGTGVGRATALEVFAVADLARCQAAARRGILGHLGADAVGTCGCPGWDGLVVAAGGHAVGDATADPDD